MDRRVLRKWLKAGVVHNGQLQRTDTGTPQGGVISPTLANITLNGLEGGLLAHIRASMGTRRASAAKVNLVRYADDFVVTGASQELLEAVVKPWVIGFLRERGLMLSEEKTRIVHIDEGFDFLGWNFRKYGGKMLIKPSKKNVKTFYRKVAEEIRASLSLPTQALIGKLNPVLKGWAKYHEGVVAKETFSKLDHLIYWRLMRWGLRRHPRKTKKWVYNHYWPAGGKRRVFQTAVRNEAEASVVHELYQLADTAIERHVKVKGAYNPFDPTWAAYGEQLRVQRMSQDIWSNQRGKLWDVQDGRCALCGHPLDDDHDAYDDHHIVYREHGGSDALSNRVLLHRVCHQRVHTLGLEVTKPVPARKGL